MKTTHTAFTGASHFLPQSEAISPTLKITTERQLVALCLALGVRSGVLSRSEAALVSGVRELGDRRVVEAVSKHILSGGDPLGDAFQRLRSPDNRRGAGAVYTPPHIIESMLSWATENTNPIRIVDPGAGSGRFLTAAAKRFPGATLLGIELDPLAALMLRANLCVLGLEKRSTVFVSDFRDVDIGTVNGQTLFLGNPPYVRHHSIDSDWKDWFAAAAKTFGIRASKLAGLHIHFFLRTLQLARKGDMGVFITSSEWLDVNYGQALRRMLSDQLGGVAVHVINPTAMPFEGTATTAAITCFAVGQRPEGLRVRTVENVSELNCLSAGTTLPWSDIVSAHRWSPLFRPTRKVPSGFIELGEVCRVHRGQVTGNNATWVADENTVLPPQFLIPTITKARDLIQAGPALANSAPLRRVVNLPVDLDEVDDESFLPIVRFLKWAKTQGADQSYVAQQRRAWWAVNLKDPAPILCTYMARRSPAFVRNLCEARHINIAHGLYPREEFSQKTLDALATWLRDNVVTEDGRTYAGGLTKFEPKELERVWIPRPESLPV